MAKIRLLVRSLQQGGRYLFSKECLLYTNTAFSCMTSVLGDLMQQNYQRLKNDNTRTWSPTRTLKMAITGIIFGPTVHYWYIFLNNKFPGRSTKAIVQKVLLDQFVFSPVCVTIFLVSVGICEGRRLDQLKNDFKDTGTLMFCTDLMLWVPAQIINFYFLSPKYRVLYDNSVSLVAEMIYSYLRFDHRYAADEEKDD